MKAELNAAGELVITIPANTVNPPLSKSEKTRIVATSNGNIVTSVMVQGKPVTIGLNAYISKS